MSATPELAAALQGAELLHDRTAVEAAIARMAARIVTDYTGAGLPDAATRPLFLTVMHGGLPFAAQLALEIGARGLDLEFDYLHATRYRGAISGGVLTTSSLISPGRPSLICGSRSAWQTRILAPLSARM